MEARNGFCFAVRIQNIDAEAAAGGAGKGHSLRGSLKELRKLFGIGHRTVASLSVFTKLTGTCDKIPKESISRYNRIEHTVVLQSAPQGPQTPEGEQGGKTLRVGFHKLREPHRVQGPCATDYKTHACIHCTEWREWLTPIQLYTHASCTA